MVRHPVLATLSRRLAADHGPVPPLQRPRRPPRRVRSLKDPARRTHPHDLRREHSGLQPRPGLLAPTGTRVQLLGALDAGRRSRHVRARHELRGRGHLRHQQRAEELPGRRGQPAGDRAEPHGGGDDEHQRGDRDQGGGAAGWRRWACWYQGNMVVWAGGGARRGTDHGDDGSDTTGGGEGTCALICLSNVGNRACNPCQKDRV